MNYLREEAEKLLHYLSSSSAEEVVVLSRLPILVRELYSIRDCETIQKLCNVYKKFYEEKIIPQFKDQLRPGVKAPDFEISAYFPDGHISNIKLFNYQGK